MKLKSLPLSLLLVASSATASDTGPNDLRSDISVALIYDLPLPTEKKGTEQNQPFSISESGALTFAGESVPRTRIAEIASGLKLNENGRLGVSVHREVRFADVLFQTFDLSRKFDFEFVGLDEHRHFSTVNADDSLSKSLPNFRGRLGEHELPLVVGHSKSRENCLIALNGELMDHSKLYDESFNWLDTLVERSGGIEAMLEKPDLIKDISVRALVSPDTPWHCVAGAIFSVQASGWPTIKFELIGVESQSL